MFYISSKRGSKYGITDTRDGIEEFYSPEKIKEISEKIKIYGCSYKGLSIVRFKFGTFEELCSYFIRYMSREGCEMGYGSDRRIESYSNRKELSIRFVMGMGSWYCSEETDDEDGYCEDICDADRLKRDASKKLHDACMKFYKDTGIYPSWQTGEKAWCYFDFM